MPEADRIFPATVILVPVVPRIAMAAPVSDVTLIVLFRIVALALLLTRTPVPVLPVEVTEMTLLEIVTPVVAGRLTRTPYGPPVPKLVMVSPVIVLLAAALTASSAFTLA